MIRRDSYVINKKQLFDMLLMREGSDEGKYNDTIQYLPMQIKVSSLGAGVR